MNLVRLTHGQLATVQGFCTPFFFFFFLMGSVHPYNSCLPCPLRGEGGSRHWMVNLQQRVHDLPCDVSSSSSPWCNIPPPHSKARLPDAEPPWPPRPRHKQGEARVTFMLYRRHKRSFWATRLKGEKPNESLLVIVIVGRTRPFLPQGKSEPYFLGRAAKNWRPYGVMWLSLLF